MNFTPYANESQSLALGAGDASLKVDNRLDAIALYGQVDLTRDKRGLSLALELKAVLDGVVSHLQAIEARGQLPATIDPPKAPGLVPNPFA